MSAVVLKEGNLNLKIKKQKTEKKVLN